MLKSKKEITEFIKLLFDCAAIEINNIPASTIDLVSLCERIARGEERVQGQKQYIQAGQVKKICIYTL